MPASHSQQMHTPEANQADAALRAGHLTKSISIARAALRKAPKDPELRFILAQALARTNATPEALKHLKELCKEHPDHTGFRVELAYALESSGLIDEALAEIDRVLNANPDHDFAIRIRVKVLRGIGKGAQAWSELAPRLDTLPRTPHIALSLGFVIPPDADHDPVFERLDETAKNQATSAPNRQAAFYTIAKLCERAGRYQDAFAAATHANELIPQNQPDHHHKALFDQFTPKTCNAIEPADLDTSGVVLVCGMPRSGTTLTEQIIAAHPDASSAGEFSGLPIAINTILQHATKHGIVPRELTTKIARGYLKALRDSVPDRSASVLLDKLPTNHFLLGIATRLLPDLRVIRCIRDPRDIATSCYMIDFGTRHAYRSRLDTLADELILHERAAERWRADLGEAYLESSLEELVANPETNARRLVAHAGLRWDDACLRFHEQQSHVRTASVEQVQSGINASGIGRWKNYKSQLAPLIERLEQILPDSEPPSN